MAKVSDLERLQDREFGRNFRLENRNGDEGWQNRNGLTLDGIIVTKSFEKGKMQGLISTLSDFQFAVSNKNKTT